jgi:peptide/nickel transport system substrate-binding protein
MVVVTATASPSPPPPPTAPKVLDICLVGEPDTLYLYGGSQLPATRHVMEALYDGPIDHRNHSYQPVILQKLPSIADGDAVTRTVFVRRGDRVVDVKDELVELAEGVRIRSSGCYTTGCEVVFDGGMVRMNRMEVTFSLREDVSWSDGMPLTAEDSEFAFEVASDPGTPGYRYLTDRTARYRALDRWRTKWTGVPGFVDASYFLNFFPPLPRHELNDLAPRELAGDDDVRRAPLGWGPFVVDEWIPGDHLALFPNPHYFRADEGLPNVDQVTFKFTTDAAEMVTALLSGDCDLGAHSAELDVLLPLLVRLEGEGLLKVTSALGGGWEYLNFGVDPVSGYEGSRFLTQMEVRQAIAMCIDREAMMDEITRGLGVVPDSYVPPEHPLHPEKNLIHWAYDPEAGRTLLDELGWRDEDGDGVREAHGIDALRDGAAFEVTLLVSSDGRASQETARIVRAQLADCGIRVTVEARPSWELLADGPDGPLFGRRFDMAQTTWWFEDPPPCQRYLSSQVPVDGNWSGSNVTGYRNPEYDAVCLAARQSLPGMPAYERYHKQSQILFSQDLPALPLFVWPRVALGRPGVESFAMDATAESELWGLEILNVEGEGASSLSMIDAP